MGTQTANVNFQGANRQFAWLEISFVYDKSDQHQTIYSSCNAKIAAMQIQSLALENASSTYSLIGGLEYNIYNEDDKHWLYQCGPSCNTTPLTEYINNKIYQELPKERNFLPTRMKSCILTRGEARVTHTSWRS